MRVRLALALLLFAVSWAQSQTPRAQLLTTADGLPASMVIGMEQDEAGFIWIATTDGLARYDGQRVKVFKHDPANPNSLIDNEIIGFSKSQNRFLIVTQSDNIQLFDPVAEHFATLFTAQYLKTKNALMRKCVLSADGKHLWGFMQGVHLVHYDFEKKKFTVYTEKALTGHSNALHDFLFSERGFVYAFCGFGIIRLDTRTNHRKLIPFAYHRDARGKDILSDFRGVCAERPNGELVLPLQRSVLIYNPTRNTFRKIPLPGRASIKQEYFIRSLQDGSIYVGATDLLYKLLPDNHFEILDRNPQNLYQAYYADTSEGLWLARADGLEKRSLKPPTFQAYPYRKSFKEDLIQQHLRIPHRAVQSQLSTPLLLSTPTSSWFVEMDTVYRFDFEKKLLTKTTFPHCCNIATALGDQSRVWTYTNYYGLMVHDPTLTKHRLLPNSLTPLFSSERGLDVVAIAPTERGVWVACNYGQGLLFYDFQQKKYATTLLSNPTDSTTLTNNSLVCLKRDALDASVLWVGTTSGGLCRLDTRTLKVKRLLEKDGLPNATILALETDSRGFLWGSTNKGLFRLTPKTLQIRTFTQADGLQDNEFTAHQSAALPDGRLAFGGHTGITMFDPKAISEGTQAVPVVFTSLKINNETVEATTPGSPLSTSINNIETLDLDHTQNFLTLEFAGLEYDRPQQIRYRHRLSGVDKNWVNTGTQSTANYTQLSDGHYTFEVLATNADGVWGKTPRQLSIIIRPPWWASGWAYGLYTLALGGVVYWFVQNRLVRARQQREVELKRREAEQLKSMDELKTRFYTNITHEFRTPLTLILSPTEKLMHDAALNDPTRKVLHSINRNARHLLRLIGQLLDLSKLESGTMKVTCARGNFQEFVQEIVESFSPQAQSRSISLSHVALLDQEVRLFDEDKMEKILDNLLSNALKFTEPGGHVKLKSVLNQVAGEPDRDLVELTVSDSGLGIDSEKLPYVFDRFYQAEMSSVRRFEGTGIGLSLVKELTELMGGRIEVQSESGVGTEFRVVLPLPKADKATAQVPLASFARAQVSGPRFAKADHAPQPDESKPLLLLVEDHQELREFMAESLAPEYRILTAVNGMQGWEMVRNEIPDVVVSDVMMPYMDGYELCEKIKADATTNHVAVVLLTARAAHEKKVQGLSLGADDYLIKPFHPDELGLRIRNLVTHKQHLRNYYYRQFGEPDVPLDQENMADEFMQKLHGILEQQLDNTAFTVDHLAREVGMSRRTLHRKLSATTQLSPNELIRNYRLKRAATLLKKGKNASETAYLVGFESPAYFATSFKEFFQKTPTEYAAS